MALLPGSSIRGYDSDLASRQSNFYNGALNMKNLEYHDPYVSGWAMFFWTKLPRWMVDTFPGFAAFTQKNFKSFQGLSDMELQTIAVTYGFNGNEYNVASGFSKQNTDFTIKHQEYSGQPVSRMYNFWVSGIRDPNTGVALYPELFNIEYSAANHTGELLYVVTRPDITNCENHRVIEFAAYYTNVLPTKMPLGHYNFDLNSHDQAEPEQAFKGTVNIGPRVDNYAAEVLKTAYRFRSEGVFDPASSSTDTEGTITSGSAITDTGTVRTSDEVPAVEAWTIS